MILEDFGFSQNHLSVFSTRKPWERKGISKVIVLTKVARRLAKVNTTVWTSLYTARLLKVYAFSNITSATKQE